MNKFDTPRSSQLAIVDVIQAIGLTENVCMDQQASAARKEYTISQQAAGGTQQAGLMAVFQPHRALLPATQKSSTRSAR